MAAIARSSDSFKPRLPLDPFSGMDIRQPWPVDHDQLAAALSSLSKQVVLILGCPSHEILTSLTTAKSLSSSLILIATHNPPVLSEVSLYGPTVRVLVLSEPLFTRDAGALRLVNLLQCAEKVARVWRVAGLNYKKSFKYRIFDEQPRILYLAEAEAGGEFSKVYAPPPGSKQNLATPPPSRPPSTMSTSSSFSKSASKRLSKVLTALPQTDPSQRPFDAILDFLELSAELGEKALLKQAILVTTLSQPFLSAIPSIPSLRPTISKRKSTGPVSASGDGDKSCNSSIRTVSSAASIKSAPVRWNSFISSKSALSSSPLDSGHFFDSIASTPGRPVMPMVAHVERSHLIHVLPPSMQDGLAKNSRSKLTQSIEQFLVNFAYPESSFASSAVSRRFSSASMSNAEIAEGQCEKAVPFLVPTHALCAIPVLLSGLDAVEHSQTGAPMSIAELILNGLLDPKVAPESKRRSLFNALENPPRAWIGSVVEVKPASEVRSGGTQIPSVPENLASVSLPNPRRESSFGTNYLSPPRVGRRPSSKTVGSHKSDTTSSTSHMSYMSEPSIVNLGDGMPKLNTLSVQTAIPHSALPTPPDSSSSDEDTPVEYIQDTQSLASTLDSQQEPGWFRSETTLPAVNSQRLRVDSAPTPHLPPLSRTSLFGRNRRKSTVDPSVTPEPRKSRWKFWART